MRLWHKDLIPVLPDKQLLGQWRECCAIASNIANKGTPNHILVNKIMNYSTNHFWTYGIIISTEMDMRGYKCNFEKFAQYFPIGGYSAVLKEDLFKDWHNRRYLMQCIYNLQEKYDCGGISFDDWTRLLHYFEKLKIYL